MGLEDFCSCTPSEFEACWSAWRGQSDRALRNGWEQTRTLAVAMLQPYSRRTLRGRDVLPLPWDVAEGPGRRAEERIDAEERARRYEAAKKRYGIE